MKPRIRKSADARKLEIIETAIRLAGEIGPDRLTTERLAQEIGISQPGIFRHFPTKAEIWEAVAHRIGDLMREKVELSENKPTNPVEQLQQLVINQLKFIETTPAIPAILFSRELHAENEKLLLYFAGLISNRQQGLTKLIEASITKGYFKKELSAEDGAFLILALIQGLAMRWSLNARSFGLVEEGERLLKLQLEGFNSQ